jgi:hypothetical protein
MITRVSLVSVLLLTGCEEGAFLDTASLDVDLDAVERQTRAPVVKAVVAGNPGQSHDRAVLTVLTDRGDDGTIDSTQETTFDENHQRVLLREDRDGDGVFERVTAYAHVWDQGRIIRIETDEGADGTLDGVETREYTLSGQLWRTVRDDDADGTPERIDESTWDANGRRIRSAMDMPAGGVVETLHDYMYGNDNVLDGRLLRRFNDSGMVQSTRYENEYLPNGRLGRLGIDLQDDGAIDNRVERIYDNEGRMIGSLTDTGADGTIDTLHSYVYSDEGRLTELAIDIGNDGQYDTVIYRDYHNFAPVNQGCP